MSLDGLGEINRAFVVAFKMPAEKQISKYEKLAEQLTAEHIEILRFSTRPKSNKQIQEDGLGLKKHSDNFKRYLEPLLNLKLLNRTLPGVPNSPLQQYFTTSIGQMILLIIDFKSHQIKHILIAEGFKNYCASLINGFGCGGFVG